MTFLSPARFIVSTFSSSGVSTKGPFLSDLLMFPFQWVSGQASPWPRPLTSSAS
jgi:hypothetical protein